MTTTETTSPKIEVGQGWAVRYLCDCGNGHAVNNGYLRVLAVNDRLVTVEDPEGEQFDVTVEDPIEGDRFDADVYLHIAKHVARYGSDADPVAFEHLIDTVSIVERGGVSLTVTRYEAQTYSAERATVSVTEWGRRGEVTVSGPDRAFGTDRPAMVNWSALGSVEVGAAAAYAAAISLAAEVAATLRPAPGSDA